MEVDYLCAKTEANNYDTQNLNNRYGLTGLQKSLEIGLAKLMCEKACYIHVLIRERLTKKHVDWGLYSDAHVSLSSPISIDQRIYSLLRPIRSSLCRPIRSYKNRNLYDSTFLRRMYTYFCVQRVMSVLLQAPIIFVHS